MSAICSFIVSSLDNPVTQYSAFVSVITHPQVLLLQLYDKDYMSELWKWYDTNIDEILPYVWEIIDTSSAYDMLGFSHF